MTAVIITDADSRKSFDIYNIVKKNCPGVRIILTAEKDFNFQLPVIYRQKIYKLSTRTIEEYAAELDKIVSQNDKDGPLVYFPVSDKNIGLFYQYLEMRGSTGSPVRYLLPSYESYKTALHKNEFQAFCEQHLLPVPQRLFKEDIEKLQNNFYPVIVKPFQGTGSAGLRFINDKTGLPDLARTDLNKNIVQKKISNGKDIEGAFFLVRNGEVINWYTHQRLRTFPESGGVTVYSKSTENEKLFRAGELLLQKLNWSGLAMVEFMFDPEENEYKIIELNPRTWGSFLLSEKTGLKFTENYINLCIGKPAVPVIYKEAYIRWFIPFDLFLYFKNRFAVKKFWRFDTSNTAYINFSYGGLTRVLFFQLYFIFNISSLKTFSKKIFGTKK